MHAALRLMACLATATLLTGCTFGADADENAQKDIVAGDYVDGPGVVLVVHNEATVHVGLTWIIETSSGSHLKTVSGLVPPGQTIEMKTGLPQGGPLRAQLQWNWTADGRAASGVMPIEFDTLECEGLTQVTWTMMENGGSRTARADGSACE